MIKSNTKSAQIQGSYHDIGVSMTILFDKIFTEYGMEEGQKMIDEALNLAIKS